MATTDTVSEGGWGSTQAVGEGHHTTCGSVMATADTVSEGGGSTQVVGDGHYTTCGSVMATTDTVSEGGFNVGEGGTHRDCKLGGGYLPPPPSAPHAGTKDLAELTPPPLHHPSAPRADPPPSTHLCITYRDFRPG